jgi:hypothetical protein
MIRQNAKFTQQELPAAAPDASASGIDFFKARDRLSAGFEQTGEEFEIKREIRMVATRRLPSVRQSDRFEESVYWLLSAATLAYLVLRIIGL